MKQKPKINIDELVKQFDNANDEDKVRNECTQLALQHIKACAKDGKPPDDSELANDILGVVQELIRKLRDSTHPSWRTPRRLDIPQVELILRDRWLFANIRVDGGFDPQAPTVLMRYDPDEGIYTSDMHDVERAISELTQHRANKAFRDGVYLNIEAVSPVLSPCDDKGLIPVGNGVYELETGNLLPFSPEMVFITKTPIDYNPDAENVIITDHAEPWDIESWLSDLTDDDEITRLLWQILSASVRPAQNFSKAIWLYSEVGNNGKGTFCELVRRLVGPHNVATLSIKDFGMPFALENLFTKSIVICDENDVGKFIDDAANYKSAVTADVINANRKHKSALSIRFNGLIIECMNGFPKTRDKTGSFYRRLLLVPFNKSFQNSEKKYIKNDYIKRKEVLEYVLKKALQNEVTEFIIPQASEKLIDTYRVYNNSVLDFWREFREQFAWSLIPSQFLFELYVAYFRRNAPSSRVITFRDFTSEMRNIIDGEDEWEYGRFTVGKQMDDFENLIIEYNLTHWMDPLYTGNVPEKITNFARKEQYTGVRRVSPKPETKK